MKSGDRRQADADQHMDGVHRIAPDGTLLGRIKVPFTVSNLEFGGRNGARLSICASHTLFANYTNTRGAARLKAGSQRPAGTRDRRVG